MTSRFEPATAALAPVLSVDPALDAVRLIHRRLSPEGAVHGPGFVYAGSVVPATMFGGDWWAAHELADGRLMIAIGDVAGHDLAAAMIAMLARGILEGVVRSVDDSLTASRALTLLATTFAERVDDRFAMTCCIVVLDPDAGTLHVANAGHPFPLVRRANGALEAIAARGAPIGCRDPAIGTTRVAWRPGDALALLSDGVADRLGPGGARFGERRTRTLLTGWDPARRSVGELLHLFMTALRAFAGGTLADDDMTCVLCEYAGPTSPRVRHPIGTPPFGCEP